MKYLLLGTCTALLALSLVPALVMAQNQPDASVGITLSTKEVRCNRVELPACEDTDIEIQGELYTPYYAYLTVFKGEASVGIAGLGVGIRYQNLSGQGVDVFGWTSCSDLEFPNSLWPASGGSNRLTWTGSSNCQTTEPGGAGDGVTAVAGYFYVIAYSDDALRVDNGRWGNGSYINVADCAAAESVVPMERAGYVSFSEDGSTPGFLPCGRNQEDTTFGRVKSSYNDR